MDALCVVGLSWRHGDERALAAYTLPPEERAERVARLREQLGAREVVYLATCNRVEVTLIGDGKTPLVQYRERVHRLLTGREPQNAAPIGSQRAHPKSSENGCRLRAWGGEGALEHLFLVASGLDSAQVGEHEIPGQIRQSMELARQAGTVGPQLEWVLGEALRVGRSVRDRSAIGAGRLSLAEIAVHRVLDHLAEIDASTKRARSDRPSAAVALIGVSDMTRRCAERFTREGVPLIWVNRSVERVRPLARELSSTSSSTVVARDLATFLQQPDAVEAVVSATGSAQPLFDRAPLERLASHSPSGYTTLLVDLAIPPDIDPQAVAAVGLERIGMDEVIAEAQHTSERRSAKAAAARELVDEALDEIRQQMSHRALAPVLAELGRRYRETAVTGVERLMKHQLSGLDADGQQVVLRWAETLAQRLAHIPMVGLRALAAEPGLPAVKTFLDASGDPLIEQLAAALAAVPELPIDRAGDLS